MARADRRARGHRDRRRRFNGYIERVSRLSEAGHSVATIATVTRTDEWLVRETLRFMERDAALEAEAKSG